MQITIGNTMLVSAAMLALALAVQAASAQTIYDEAKVPKYTLPDPLTAVDGTKVTDAKAWRARRAEIYDIFATQMYGKMPAAPKALAFKVTSKSVAALEGKAMRREVTATFLPGGKGPAMTILIYLPASAKGPVPLFVGMNFQGNHTISTDPGITITKSWVSGRRAGVVNNRAGEKSRGAAKSRWPVEQILARGYGLATIYYGDIDPDYHDKFANGVHPLFYRKGQTAPAPDEWGSISAWAWGLSRAMDYFQTAGDVDPKRVAVMGHSRLGKTSVWAGASDERFALVISNNSGCGGAALSKRCFGETVGRINKSFPHWFCGNFKQYSNNESALPFDQHMLIALMAPRPVLVCSAKEDRWADPRGEFLAAKGAHEVYRLLGRDGLTATKMPAPGKPVLSRIGYSIREGKHNVLPSDWKVYMDFADKHMGAATK